MNVGNLLITLGIVMIVIFSGVEFYTEMNVATANPNFLNLTGFDSYDEYNSLYATQHDVISSPTTSFSVDDLGNLVFGAGYSSLRSVFTGQWLVVTGNILTTSVGASPFMPQVIFGIILSIVGIAFLLITIGALMGRTLIGR
jgi:hypothetical protein